MIQLLKKKKKKICITNYFMSENRIRLRNKIAYVHLEE